MTVISYGPEAPRALQDLNWIIHAGSGDRVREPVLMVNNVFGILQAVESGMGLASAA